MLQQKSTKDILQKLQSALEKMNPEKKQPLFNQDDNLILKNAPEINKKKWVISKMVSIRAAIYSEYSNQIRLAEKKDDLNNAIDLMNDYIFTFTLPFIDNLKPPSRIDRISARLSKKSVLSPYEYLEKWKADYIKWQQIKSSEPKLETYLKSEKYREMGITYNMLYDLSFSSDNVPESQAFVFVDRNKVKI
jgi:hypothetical protein